MTTQRKFLPVTSAVMQASLRRVAERHGYMATRGPRVGEGNPSELIQALDTGEIATVRLPQDERVRAIAWLRDQATAMTNSSPKLAETLLSLADQLR